MTAAPPARVILVEGASDRIAVEAAARRLGWDLAGVAVVSAEGVGNIGGLAARYRGLGVPVAGLCDLAEVVWVCRALVKAKVGIALDRAGLAALGFHALDRDLEDELIRAVGLERVLDLLAEHGDLEAFRTLQRQRAWRDAALTDQLRRFLAAGAGRKIRYAGVFVEALALERMPAPVLAVLAALPGLRPDPVLV